MQVYNLEELKEFAVSEFRKKEIVVTDSFKLLLIYFEPGQSVPPCVMECSTAFYIVEGQGLVSVSDQEYSVSAGSIILIEPDLTRQIKAKTRLVVLAMQYE
ncbi:MAG: cupin domain-containing protein [Bacillota bacterium]